MKYTAIVTGQINGEIFRLTGAGELDLASGTVLGTYDIDQMAEAIHYALTMDPAEQMERMSRMRQVLEERNIYRWAGDLLNELTRVRNENPLVFMA